MTQDNRHQAGAEWRSYWPLAVCSSLGLGLGVMHIYSMGAFIGPLSRQFGWGRFELSAGLMIVTLVSIIASYFVGRLIDRIGPRRLALPGLAVYCLAFCSFAALSGPLWQWWLCWSFIAIADQATKPTVWATAITSRFTASRGLALAIMMMGTSVASSINPFIATFLIENYGWRMAYVGLAAIWALLTIPACFLFFHSATDPAKRGSEAQAAAPRTSLPGINYNVALKGSRFWRLSIAMGLITCVTIGLTVHIVPALIDSGMSGQQAALIAGILGISSIVGRLGMGILLDKIDSRIVIAAVFSFPALACLIFLSGDNSGIMASGAAILIGLALGAEGDVGAYMVSRYFGLRHFGTLYGVLVGVLGIAVGTGPLLAGLSFDLSSSYAAFFLSCIPVCILTSLLMVSLGRPPELVGAEDGQEPVPAAV